jgi:hypothetical protein
MYEQAFDNTDEHSQVFMAETVQNALCQILTVCSLEGLDQSLMKV